MWRLSAAASLVALTVMADVIRWLSPTALPLTTVAAAAAAPFNDGDTTAELRISLTISARQRNVEISWTGLPRGHTGIVYLTDVSVPLNSSFYQLPKPANPDDQYYVHSSSSSADDDPIRVVPSQFDHSQTAGQNKHTAGGKLWPLWSTTDGVTVRYALRLNGTSSGWHTTDVSADANRTTVTVSTGCYGFWATFVPDGDGSRMQQQQQKQTCLRAYPRWMNELRPHIQSKRMRDLFLVGTHDSGSYRAGFDPRLNETRVSKYTLTQDDDVHTQLLLGVRYLDIRVGSYRKKGASALRSTSGGDGGDLTGSGGGGNSGRQFWVNHGISRLQPLDDVLRQVRDFVLATDELVIFDVQEFPVGFDNKAERHRALVYHLQQALHNVLVSARLGWDATLEQIWRSGGRVIVSYDHRAVVEEFSDVVFQSVQQRWGDVQTVEDLRRYLSPAERGFMLITGRPIADMAEMTPTPWDVLTDKYGGLRRMADDTNREMSRWYAEEWGADANIVAADFVRGTTLMESSMRWNRRRFV